MIMKIKSDCGCGMLIEYLDHTECWTGIPQTDGYDGGDEALIRWQTQREISLSRRESCIHCTEYCIKKDRKSISY